MYNGLVKRLIFLLHNLKGNKKNFHGLIFIYFWNGHGQKNMYQNFDKRWVVHNFNQHIQKVGNP